MSSRKFTFASSARIANLNLISSRDHEAAHRRRGRMSVPMITVNDSSGFVEGPTSTIDAFIDAVDRD